MFEVGKVRPVMYVTSLEPDGWAKWMRTGTMPNILVVEDNPSDVELLRYFISTGPMNVKVLVAQDGVEALRMLRGEGPYEQAVRPDLILLDLNLPRKDGRQVLAELKQDPALQQIPVIVLSTSGASPDVSGAYRLHANCYLQKPSTAEDFRRTVQGIEEFWLSLAKLPEEQPSRR